MVTYFIKNKEYNLPNNIYYYPDIHFQIITFIDMNYHQLSYHYICLKHRNIYHDDIIYLRNKKRLVALLSFYYPRYLKNKDTFTFRVFPISYNCLKYLYNMQYLEFTI